MSKEIDDLNKQLEKEVEVERRKKDVFEKDLTLREHRVNLQLNELIKNKTELEEAKKINFGEMSPETVEQLVKDNDEYMEAAKKSMTFINNEFKGIVPFFRKNLILVGADTGHGKSTVTAGIAFSVISQINPSTEKKCKCLVIVNEERPEDIFNRVTALIHGFEYTNHDQFTEEQRQTFREFIPKLAKDGRLTVIGDVYQGIPDFTTTVEGIETIFNNLIQEMTVTGEIPYDCILIDYFQNVTRSKNDPKLDEFNCQRRLALLLDQMKSRYPGPIVLMAQMKKLIDEEDSTPFNIRLKGSKLICDKCTFICELIPEKDYYRSKWKLWKSRFTKAIDNREYIYTGYDRGKFVPYSEDFIKRVAKKVEERLERKKIEELGMGDDTKKSS